MSKKEEKKAILMDRGSLVINLSRLLEDENFSNFKELRVKAYRHIHYYRLLFLKTILNAKGIPFEEKMGKREKAELFEKHMIGIIRDEDKNYDMIYVGGSLAGYWCRDFEMKFRKGQLICKVSFKTF